MKKKLLFLFLLFYTSTTLAVDAGFLLGAGISDIEGSNYFILSEEGGFRLGVPLRFQMSELFDLRTGFFYSLRKFQETITTPVQDSEEYRMGYLEIPLLAQLKITNWLGLFAGPIYGINVTNQVKIDSLGLGYTVDQKKSIFLAQAGVGLTFGSYGMDLIYEKGLTRVFDNSDGKWIYYGINFIYWFSFSDEPYYSF